MPFFVRVGGIGTNDSGVGARGWFIKRVGSSLEVRWGGISVETDTLGRSVKFYWRAGWPQKKWYYHANGRAAMNEMTAKIAEKTARGQASGDAGYTQLPKGKRILSAR